MTPSGVMLQQGTLMDASIPSAPSSIKNKDGKRDPEMHQAKKGNQWYFGMKMHIGADERSGAVKGRGKEEGRYQGVGRTSLSVYQTGLWLQQDPLPGFA